MCWSSKRIRGERGAARLLSSVFGEDFRRRALRWLCCGFMDELAMWEPHVFRPPSPLTHYLCTLEHSSLCSHFPPCTTWTTPSALPRWEGGYLKVKTLGHVQVTSRCGGFGEKEKSRSCLHGQSCVRKRSDSFCIREINH